MESNYKSLNEGQTEFLRNGDNKRHSVRKTENSRQTRWELRTLVMFGVRFYNLNVDILGVQ